VQVRATLFGVQWSGARGRRDAEPPHCRRSDLNTETRTLDT